MDHMSPREFIEKHFPKLTKDWNLVFKLEELGKLAKNHATWQDLLDSKKARAEDFFQRLDPELLSGPKGNEVKKAFKAYFEHVRSVLDAAADRGRNLLKD